MKNLRKIQIWETTIRKRFSLWIVLALTATLEFSLIVSEHSFRFFGYSVNSLCKIIPASLQYEKAALFIYECACIR